MSGEPYQYPPTQRRTAYPYSNFHPRATTQGAYQAIFDRDRPRPKQDGPLIKFDKPVNSYMVVSGNGVSYTPAAYEAMEARKKTKPEGKGPLVNFNRHPDSWEVVTPGRADYKPMPASTRTKVTAIRWTQFALRVIEEIAAIGMLVCMICLKGMPTSLSWIMRIFPAWDVLITLYAIYHLLRPANARPPESSANYHIFALVNDVGLMAFYIYTCLYSRTIWSETPSTKARWTSLFSNTDTTTLILLATFIGTAAIAGLHLISAFLDLWLTLLFKAIARLPPDVNPLEDNLTTRAPRTSKHKHKDSDATLATAFSEKHPAFLSGSTLSVEQSSRLSNTSKINIESESRNVPFGQTRAPFAVPSPYKDGPERASWDEFEEVKLYKQSEADRNSRVNLDSPSRVFDKQLSKHVYSAHPNEVIPKPPPFTDRSSGGFAQPSQTDNTSINDFARMSSPAVPNAAPSVTGIQYQQKTGLLNNNWYVLEDDESDISALSRPGTSDGNDQYAGLSSISEERFSAVNVSKPSLHQAYLDEIPQPLKMNPPTPPPAEDEYPDPANEDTQHLSIPRKPLASRSDNGNGSLQRQPTTASSVYSNDSGTSTFDVRAGTPKGKYYGDLTAATRGVLGTKAKPTTEISRITSNEGSKANGTTGTGKSGNTGRGMLSGIFPRRQDSKGRVVSRTGVDIAGTADEDSGWVGRGRRDVSGKVAEEGRGGVWWNRKG